MSSPLRARAFQLQPKGNRIASPQAFFVKLLGLLSVGCTEVFNPKEANCTLSLVLLWTSLDLRVPLKECGVIHRRRLSFPARDNRVCGLIEIEVRWLVQSRGLLHGVFQD